MRIPRALPRACAVAGSVSLVLSSVVGTSVASTSATPGAAAKPSFVLPELTSGGGSNPMGRLGVSAESADFDNDGHVDVLVPNINRAGIVVLLGDGAGGLSEPVITTLPSAGSAIDAGVGDLDGDGNADAVAATISDAGGGIRVLLGKGDGTFELGQSISYPASAYPMVIDLADIDGDDDLDFAVSVDRPAGDYVEVAKNNGSASFGSRVEYVPDFQIAIDSLDLADVDDDGDPDLVYLAGCPTVRLNNGSGAFGNGICSSDGSGRLSGVAVVLADFDGDEVIDIALGDASGGHVTIGRGDGAGKFVFEVQYGPLGRQVDWIAAGDFTGDGVMDIVATADQYESTPARVVALLRGNGDGTFVHQASYATGGDGPTGVDLNEDGLLDLVAAGFDAKQVSATINEGKGVFHAPRVYVASGLGIGTIVRTADVNGDGRGDVVAATGARVDVFLQSKKGELKQPPISSNGSGQMKSMVLGDVNGDHKVDVIAGTFPSNNVFVMLGQGDGKFGAPQSYNNGSTAAVLGIAADDVDGDGKIDIVSNTFSQLSVLRGNGDGTFKPAVISGTGAGFQVATVLGDFTGDGDLDAVAVIQTGSADDASSLVVLNVGKGDGTFTTGGSRTVDTNANSAAAVGRGRGDDLGVALVGLKGFHTGRTGLFLLSVTGGALGSPTYLGGPGSDLTSADLNGDKNPDIATIGDSVINVFTGTRTGEVSLATSFGAGPDGFYIASGDVTGSKRIDLVELDDTNPAQVTVYENSTSKR